MRSRYFILLIVCFCISLQAIGQQILTIHGVVSRKLSEGRLSQVLVNNLRSKDIMMSDELGWFTVKAAVGDTLLFTKSGYTDQKVVVANGSDMPVYMQPMIQLSTVTIQGETKKQELNDALQDYNRKGVYYDGHPPVLSLLLNPLNDLHEWLGKDAADLRRFKADAKDELQYTEVQRRYNPEVVKRITNAPDSVIKKFMEYYRPSYEDMKQWNDYDLVKQIKKSFDYYIENKDDLDLPALVSPPLQKPNDKQKPGN
jgi:hypothetical protein